jgi:hypothetical protein
MAPASPRDVRPLQDAGQRCLEVARWRRAHDGVLRGWMTRAWRRGVYEPAAPNNLPIAKPTAAAPRPITTICAPLLRQSPMSVNAE